MNYYNPYGNFCMEYSDDSCEVMGIVVVDSKEILWRMKVPKKVAKDITPHHLAEHYLKTKYSKMADVQQTGVVIQSMLSNQAV